MAERPAEPNSNGPAHAVHHGPSLLLLAGVLAALLVLTFITVAVTWTAWLDFGHLNVWVALLIATVKAALVVLYFMHLRYDKPFNAVVLIGALFFVVLFIGIATQDTLRYRGDIQQWRATQIREHGAVPQAIQE